MRKGTLTFLAFGLLTTACGAQSPVLQKQNDKLALELADLRNETRRERVRVQDLEKQLALSKAKKAEEASEETTVARDRPALPVEVRSAPQLRSEQDLPDSYDDFEVMGTDDEGTEIIYVGEAASNKVIKIPPNHFKSSTVDDDDDYGYDDEPARPSLRSARAAKARVLEPVPTVSERLTVTRGVPTIDSQLRQARQPQPLPRRTHSFGDPRAEYRRYYEALRAGNHSYALTGFRNFVERFPGHDFADNAQYWIGETFYDQKRFKSALVEFRKVVDNHPDGNKVPDGLLKLGYCYHQLGEVDKALQVWQQVVQLYPKSNPATLARTKLSALED